MAQLHIVFITVLSGNLNVDHMKEISSTAKLATCMAQPGSVMQASSNTGGLPAC